MKHSNQFRKGDVTVLSLSHLAHDTFSAFLAPLLPLLIAKLGMSLSMTAFLDIARRIPALFNPLLGLITERTGGKYIVILTPAVTAVSMCLIGLADSFAMLLILLFVAGISAALFHIPTPVIIKEASGDRIGTGMSFFMVGGELARTLGPLLAISAVSMWGLEGIYRLIPLAFASSGMLYLKLRNYDVHARKKKKEKGDTRRILKNYWPLFVSLGAFIFFQAAMKSALTLYLPVYLTGQGASLWFAGISLSVLQFFGVVGTFWAGNISDRIGRRATLVFSSIGSLIFMLIFIYTQNIAALSILGLFLFASGPVLMAGMQDTNSSMPTFMNSMYMFTNFGASSVIVFLVGLMGDTFGLERTYFYCTLFAAGTIPAGFFFTAFIREMKEDDPSV